MPAFLLRRLLHAVFVTWGVVTVVFFLVRLTGDPTLFLVDQSATQEEIAHTRSLLGLDRPLAVQYVEFVASAVRGDFGASIREKRPAMRMVLEHFWPATVELAAAALLLSTVLAVPLGVISATHRGRAADHASRIASLFLQSMPSFWLGFMLSGALIIETVFAWPGMGRLIVQAVPGRDFPVIQAGVFVFALVFVAINLIVDVLYTVADPRVRLT